MTEHGPGNIIWSAHSFDPTYVCKCGEIRPSIKQMTEHTMAAAWLNLIAGNLRSIETDKGRMEATWPPASF